MPQPAIRPIGAKIMLEPLRGLEFFMLGHKIPDTVMEDIPPCQGRVVAVGRRVTKVGPGARVVYSLGVEEEVTVGDEGFVFIDEQDVICVLG